MESSQILYIVYCNNAWVLEMIKHLGWYVTTNNTWYNNKLKLNSASVCSMQFE